MSRKVDHHAARTKGHRIPPAPPPRNVFPLPSEFDLPEALGLVLWRALRDVTWWARSGEAERCELFRTPNENVQQRFSAAAECAPEIASSIATFLNLLSAPAEIPPSKVAGACHHVSEWADANGLSTVRTLFAEAAAYADEDTATWANLAAKSCRRDANYTRAEIWYERAFRIGVKSGKKREQVWALLGYGTLMYARGRYRRARAWYTRAATRAARTNQPGEAAEAEHDLMTIESEIGTYRQGAWHLRRALTHYPVRHWRLPFLVHDFAYLLIQNQQYAAALPLLRPLRAIIPRVDQQLLLSAIARAAAGAGSEGEYQAARAEVLELAPLRPEQNVAALRNLAEAALLLEKWDLVAEMATAIGELARERGERDMEQSAKDLIRRAALHDMPAAGPAKRELSSVDDLSQQLLQKLTRWQAPGRGRPGAPRKSW